MKCLKNLCDNCVPNWIHCFINGFKKINVKYYRDIFDRFKSLMNQPINQGLVSFMDQRPLKDLVYLQLKCKETDIKNPERVMQFLNNEINRKIYQSSNLKSTIAILLSIATFIITIIYPLIKNGTQ